MGTPSAGQSQSLWGGPFNDKVFSLCVYFTVCFNILVSLRDPLDCRYGREVSDFSRDEQLDNPEVIVCPVLSGEVRVQLAHLRRVTQEMNVITRSEACPEDDEDCEVDELRCNFNVSA